MIHLDGVSKLFRIPHARRNTFFHKVVMGGSYRYETLHALRGVSLRVASGEFVGVVGRNGSGKSTLLRVVAGIYPPSSGSVLVEGKLAPILELGVVFQGALRVHENVLLYGALLGIPRRRLIADLDEILLRAGIERFRDAQLDSLSTGLRMRLAYTIGMRAEATVLLVDEALSVGDESFRRRCLEELVALRGRRTALLVSHDHHVLLGLCDRIVVLDAGEVVAAGLPEPMIELYLARANADGVGTA